MPPQSDMERLTEVKTSIADRGFVSQADAESLAAIGENLTGDRRKTSEFGDMASANALIAELEEVIRTRDRDIAKTTGNTGDDGKGSAELGTDAIHRAEGQTGDDKPTPNAPVDAEAAADDLDEDEDEVEEVEEEDPHTGQKTKVKRVVKKAKAKTKAKR